ncbi:MAG: 7-carboxy-7-deazaguanine synthase QueE [Theionarchaea archaeon]|nr:7-carboxy-7-deazaguanine synthase QueE [Theionarchaea archaeon]
MLNVSEIFFSLNGEGVLIGVPTVFVRLSGCNLRCTWCDTKYAWEEGAKKDVEQIAREVKKEDNGFCEWVLLTGGEPLLQEIGGLVDELKSIGFTIGIETNGSLYKDVLKKCDFISVDIKTPSSQNPTSDMTTFAHIANVIEEKKGQMKAVIADENDYQFIHTFVREAKVAGPLVLQPCWGRMTYNQLCHLYFEHPVPHRDIRILTQIHKLGDIK